jgi:hypothetical protein
MKEIIAIFLGFSLLLATLGAICIAGERYTSPHHSCVHAQVSDKEHPMSEAEAHLTCGRWLNGK